MTDKTPSKPRFAPVWPHLNEVPNHLQTILGGNRVSAFNRGGLTAEELKPLTETFQTPYGKAFRAMGHVFLWLFCVQGAFWAAVLILDALCNFLPPETATQTWITRHLITGLNALRDANFMILAIMVPVLAVLYAIHFAAWRKWRADVAGTWERAGNRLVRTKSLPRRRRKAVNRLGDELDCALRRLDPADAEHSRLATEAVAAIGRYIDLPEPAEGAEAVAESPWQDEAVQKVRRDYEAVLAAEQLALADAEKAVRAVGTVAREIKASAAEQKIVDLAQRILEGSAS